MKLYIIAGEASGDRYGAGLMRELKLRRPDLEIRGIGGPLMEAEGLNSLFPMGELSLMGFWEIVPHIPKLLRRIRETVEDIRAFAPDMVITIDSPGFCCRVAKALQNDPFTLVHYVAPTVWAYKPGRAKKFAKLFDHLLVILPFEPPYFDAVGLKNTYIGHPIMETILPESGQAFREKHHIRETDTLICLMPGSRITEIKRLLPIFLKTVQLMTAAKNLKIAIPVLPHLKGTIEKLVDASPVAAILIDTDKEKYECLKTADIALVKSGTGTFEVAMAGCPMVVAYKVSTISYWIIRLLAKIRYVNLINLTLDRELIPEFLQKNCTPFLLSQSLDQLLTNSALRQEQRTQTAAVLENMGFGQVQKPSAKAAEVMLGLLPRK